MNRHTTVPNNPSCFADANWLRPITVWMDRRGHKICGLHTKRQYQSRRRFDEFNGWELTRFMPSDGWMCQATPDYIGPTQTGLTFQCFAQSVHQAVRYADALRLELIADGLWPDDYRRAEYASCPANCPCRTTTDADIIEYVKKSRQSAIGAVKE